jgi:DNA-binding LacI/PurR family transcriptional regulator
MNIRIPQDLAIIGFGNQLNSLIMQPQLTSINQSETSIAEISFNLMEKLINKEITIGENYTETINAQIVYRESC